MNYTHLQFQKSEYSMASNHSNLPDFNSKMLIFTEEWQRYELETAAYNVSNVALLYLQTIREPTYYSVSFKHGFPTNIVYRLLNIYNINKVATFYLSCQCHVAFDK